MGRLDMKTHKNLYWMICASVDECQLRLSNIHNACSLARPHLEKLDTHSQGNCPFLTYEYNSIISHKVGCRRISKIERVLRQI